MCEIVPTNQSSKIEDLCEIAVDGAHCDCYEVFDCCCCYCCPECNKNGLQFPVCQPAIEQEE